MRGEGKYEKRTTTIHRMTLYAQLESKIRFYCLMLNQQQPHSIANMHSTTVGIWPGMCVHKEHTVLGRDFCDSLSPVPGSERVLLVSVIF